MGRGRRQDVRLCAEPGATGGRSARLLARLGVSVAVVALAATAATTVGARDGATSGGVYRVGWQSSFGFSNNFDPTGEYLTNATGIQANLMVRTLVGTNHVGGAAGNRLVPDLATSVPTPTGEGRTYTFRLKAGVKFGPPLNRDITSKDVVYAFERLAKPKNGAQYGFYYSVIQGLEAYGAGKARTISGISTPDDHTVVFRLLRPTGDFPYRLAMPATGPMPREVAGCFEGQPGKYGRYLVSTGPYMFAGADKVDASSCRTLRPMSGFDGQTAMKLVRNPNYDPKTDSVAARSNLPEEFHFLVDDNADDIMQKVFLGELEDEVPGPPATALRRAAADPGRAKYMHLNASDVTFYLTMNLTQPPFDDVHVRRAMNWIMDKHGLVQAWGGPTNGKIANHIVPDALFNGALAEFAPYKTPGDRGSLVQAKRAMKGSKYDANGDGLCSAAACKGVLLMSDTLQVTEKMVPVIVASAKKIGITFNVRTLSSAYPAIQTTSNNVPIAIFTGWGKDYPDPLTFFTPLFGRTAIIPNGNTNYSLVGLTPRAAKDLGISGTVEGIPSVDEQLRRCAAARGPGRQTCYQALDRHLMTNVVPWVPYLWPTAVHITGPHVTRWVFDQFSGGTAYAHVAVA